MYSIAEAVESTKYDKTTTIFMHIEEFSDKKFDKRMLHSLKAVGGLMDRNCGMYFKNIEELETYLTVHMYT